MEKPVICIVGVGSLGCRVAKNLSKLGINLIVIDRDFIEENNLERQPTYNKEDIGKMKVDALKKYLKNIKVYPVDLDFDNIDLLNSNLILDCTDNIYTRFLINEYSLKTGIPWIYSSALGTKGYVKVFNNNSEGCFNCIFNEPTEVLGTCDTEGLLNKTAEIISRIQTEETLKILENKDYTKELIYYDGKITKIKTEKKENCEICNKKFKYLSGNKSLNIIKLCGTKKYLVRTKKYNLDELENKLGKLDKVKKTDYCLFFKDITIFKDGRVMLKAENEKNAKTILARYLE